MDISLTEAEWNVMECLWESAPRTGREAVEYLNDRMGWNRSTTLTLLRRLESKGVVAGNANGDIKTFTPLIDREEASIKETESLLDRIYKGSVSMLVSSLTKHQTLSREEIDNLYAILREMEEEHND